MWQGRRARNRELNDLRLVFATISGGQKQVDLRSILRLPEVKAQMAEGDLAVEDMENAWLEACAAKGLEDKGAKDGHRRSWGVCTELPFDGFVHFLGLCEAKASLPQELKESPEEPPSGAIMGRDLVVARQKMVGLLRATLTLHQRGNAYEEKEGTHVEEQVTHVGEALHALMVRAAVEEGLAHHTPETLRELMRTGVYKGTNEEVQQDLEEKKASLEGKLSQQPAQEDLVRTGVLVEASPDEVALERATNADQVQRCLEQRPSIRELADRGIVQELTPQQKSVERAFIAGKLKHDLEHREGFDELKQKGIALDMVPEQVQEQHLRAADKVAHGLQTRSSPSELQQRDILRSKEDDVARQEGMDSAKQMLENLYGEEGQETSTLDGQAREGGGRPSLADLKAQEIYRNPQGTPEEHAKHEEAGAALEQGLENRADIEELEDKGIYRSHESEEKKRLHRSLLRSKLDRALQERPDIEDLVDRGLLESAQLQKAFEGLQEDGPLEKFDDVMRWPLLESAVSERAVGMASLREAFKKCKKSSDEEGMSYAEFDEFLSETPTMQVAEERISLKLWVILRMRPELDEQEHREGNRRRNALMAEELEKGLEKREPLEHLANKGIYQEKTPSEEATEKAQLGDTLARGLAHRPDPEELTHKGIMLDGVDAGELEQSHRDARNALEGALSRRPALSDLEDMGYLEADQLEETFVDLVLEHKHQKSMHKRGGRKGKDSGKDSDKDSDKGTTSQLLLPTYRLVTWDPVKKLLLSGAAGDDDVRAALDKAKEASASAHGGDDKHASPMVEDAVNFIGFLEFIHVLDSEVEGLDSAGIHTEGDDDSARAEKHARRLQKRRERATQAADQDGDRTLKEHLVAHLRNRPSKDDPETQRIAKEFNSAEAVELERSMLRDRLRAHLRSHSGSKAEAGEGVSRVDVDGDLAARVKELEFAMNKSMLVHKLSSRPPEEILRNKGILHEQSAAQEKLERLVVSDTLKHALAARPSPEEVKEAEARQKHVLAVEAEEDALASKVARYLVRRGSREETASRSAGASGPEESLDLDAVKDAVASGLENRADLSELANKGIYQDTTPLQASLDRHLVERQLAMSLGDPTRPSKKDLISHGIYIDATPYEMEMEHYLAARNLKRALERRETMQDLKDQGIYQPEDSKYTDHERQLVKALLQQKLSNAFSADELERLKQKGIYKEAEHERLEAERALVTRQLARLVRERPDPAEMKKEHSDVLQASALALVFEERVMPRVSRHKNTGEAVVDKESDGGPEHVVSFEGLMTWPDVQEHVEGEDGEEVKLKMARHFDLCDTDGDGYITFSQFLRWVELCDLNPEDDVQVTDADMEKEYAALADADEGGMTFDRARSCRMVERWVDTAELDRETLASMWGGDGEDAAATVKDVEAFKAFCWKCQWRASAAHEQRVAKLQAEATAAEVEAKEELRSKLAEKLSSRPDLKELKKKRICPAGAVDPATEHLERNLISISLEEQLLARPAVEELEARGIRPTEETRAQLDANREKLREALDATVLHDDAQWRSHPSKLEGGDRQEVSEQLEKSLIKRRSLTELANKGIYVIDTDADYSLLVYNVLRTFRGFKKTSAELASAV